MSEELETSEEKDNKALIIKKFIEESEVKKARKPDPISANPWLLTFTDTMALMLTFFVLLYAMSEPEVEYWTDLATTLSSQFQDIDIDIDEKGPVNAITLESVDYDKALDLDYLTGVLKDTFAKSGNLNQAIISQDADGVIISFPQDLLFEKGNNTLKPELDNVFRDLIALLNQIQNKVAIHGHSDPEPISDNSRFASNWDLSLFRAQRVADKLISLGYDREPAVRGFGAGQYNLLSESLGQDQRQALSRRVDILILESNGTILDPLEL